MIPESIIRPGLVLRANDGRGALLAEVIAVLERRAVLQYVRRAKRNQRAEVFMLPLAFMASPSCGWHALDDRQVKRLRGAG